MTQWHTVHGTQDARPAELDTTSSAHRVYLRRNIQQETVHDEMTEEDRQQWVYDQMEYTREEYEALTGPATAAIMQGITEQTATTVTAVMDDTAGESRQEALMQAINQQTADIVSAITMIGIGG